MKAMKKANTKAQTSRKWSIVVIDLKLLRGCWCCLCGISCASVLCCFSVGNSLIIVRGYREENE